MSPNKFRIVLLAVLWCVVGYSEEAKKSLAVLPTTDISDLNLAEPLQAALGQLYSDSTLFQVQYAQTPLPGFTVIDIRASHQSLGTEMMSFAYMEKERISIFLFDSRRPTQFIVSSQALTDAPDRKLTSTYIESRFRVVVNDALRSYMAGRFQDLPGAQLSDKALSDAEARDARAKAERAKDLFRELSALDETPTYMGFNIGMSRFSGGGATASTVDFGGLVGYQFVPRFGAEVGVDVFSYAQAHFDLRYRIPFAEKYVSSSVSLGTGYIFSTISENRGFTSTAIANGSMRFGPGFGIDIPLLGAHLRADLRYYLGTGSIFMGTYGILYQI